MSTTGPVLIDVIAGARPNLIEIAPIVAALHPSAARGSSLRHNRVHAGQLYDRAISHSFFEQSAVPHPDGNLEVGSGTQAEQTANIMTRYKRLLLAKGCDPCLVLGDMTSTMAGAIVAREVGIEVAHVEGDSAPATGRPRRGSIGRAPTRSRTGSSPRARAPAPTCEGPGSGRIRSHSWGTR